MKLIALGDIHGREIWKEILEKEAGADKFVFIGDYFDSKRNIPTERQIDNFRELIDQKKENIDRILLTIGNHDYHYLDVSDRPYSGYQSAHAEEIGELLQAAIDENLLQMCFTSGRVAFSHAGITNTWCEENAVDQENLEESVNELFNTRPEAFEFSPGPRRDPTGDEVTQTPIWVRPQSLRKDGIENYKQVVGHTMQDKLRFDDGIILIDTLGTSKEYLYMDEEGFEARSAD